MDNKTYINLAEAYSDVYHQLDESENLMERTPVVGPDGKMTPPSAPRSGWWSNFGQKPQVSSAGISQRTGPRGTGIQPAVRPTTAARPAARPSSGTPKPPVTGRASQPQTPAGAGAGSRAGAGAGSRAGAGAGSRAGAGAASKTPPTPGPKLPGLGSATPAGLPKVPPKGTTAAKPTRTAASAPRPTAPARPSAPAPSRPAAVAPARPSAAPRPTSAPKATTTPTAPAAPVKRMAPLGQASSDSIFSRGTSMTPEQGRAAFLSKMSSSEKKTGTKTEDMDIFDLILNHLIEEGFCHSESEAIAIMSNMSEDWRVQILAHHGIEINEEEKKKVTGYDLAFNPGKALNQLEKNKGSKRRWTSAHERGELPGRKPKPKKREIISKVASAVKKVFHKEDHELYTTVLEYILENDYAYSLQEAFDIAYELSDDEIYDIFEGITAGPNSREYAVNREKMIRNASSKLKKGGMSSNDTERLKGYLQSDRRERKITGDKYGEVATSVRKKARTAKAAKMAAARKAKEAEAAKPKGMVDKAKSAIKKMLKREEYDYIIDYILDEGYSYQESVEIFEQLDDETIEMILEDL